MKIMLIWFGLSINKKKQRGRSRLRRHVPADDAYAGLKLLFSSLHAHVFEQVLQVEFHILNRRLRVGRAGQDAVNAAEEDD